MQFNRTVAVMLTLVGTVSSGHAQAPKWHWLKAADGTQFAIDKNSIVHTGDGGADAVVYFHDGAASYPQNMRRWIFDCRGGYRDTENLAASFRAPPETIAGALAAEACAGARDSRFDGVPRCADLPPGKTTLCVRR